MRISEIYGGVTSRQGEGALLGVAMPFVRVAGCQLSCSWCDSAYTWQKGYAYTEMDPDQVMAAIDALGERARACTWVSITGGEPTIYAEDVYRLCRKLDRQRKRAIIETNGLRVIDAFSLANVFVSCSPKLPGSGQDSPARRKKVARLVAARTECEEVAARTQFKFVVTGPQDLAALATYCADVGIDLSGWPGSPPVYVQPDGYIQPIEKYLEALAWLQESVPAGVRVTPQVHRLVHGPDARSV